MRPAVSQIRRTLKRGELAAARDRHGDVAVARLVSGRLVVVEDRCPHDGGRISDGFVDGELIVCPRHNWELRACGRQLERVCDMAVVG